MLWELSVSEQRHWAMLGHDKRELPGDAAGRIPQVVGHAPPPSLTWLIRSSD